jgi:hypothetical protein
MATIAPTLDAIELTDATLPPGAITTRGLMLLLLRSILATQTLLRRQRSLPDPVSTQEPLGMPVQLARSGVSSGAGVGVARAIGVDAEWGMI